MPSPVGKIGTKRGTYQRPEYAGSPEACQSREPFPSFAGVPMRPALLLCCLFLSATAQAEDCSPQTSVGSWCELPLAALHPTQQNVGLLQVEDDQAKLAGKKPKALERYLRKKEIPVVIGPGGRFYLTDRHHLSSALWRLDPKQDVPVKVIGRLPRPPTSGRRCRKTTGSGCTMRVARRSRPRRCRTLSPGLATIPTAPWPATPRTRTPSTRIGRAISSNSTGRAISANACTGGRSAAPLCPTT